MLLSLLLGVPAKQATDWKVSKKAFSPESVKAFFDVDGILAFTPKSYEAFKEKFSNPQFSNEAVAKKSKALVCFHQFAYEIFVYWTETYPQQVKHYNLQRIVNADK